MAAHLPQGRSFQPLDRLILPQWNPRIVFDKDFKGLVASIRERPQFTLRRPILVADGPKHKAGGLVHGGNQRTRALQHLFQTGWQPPAELQAAGWLPNLYPIDVSDITEQEAKAQALIDNNNAGQYQEDVLAELVAELDREGMKLEVLGFHDKRLEEIIEASGIRGDSHNAPPPPDPPASNNGSPLSSLKQVTLYYTADEFEPMLVLIEWLRQHFEVETNAEAVTLALKAYRHQYEEAAAGAGS